MDGTISLKEVWKVEEFHPGRNYRCVDGAFSQKQLGRFPSFKKLINIQCIGEKEVPKWAPFNKKSHKKDGEQQMGSIHFCVLLYSLAQSELIEEL